MLYPYLSCVTAVSLTTTSCSLTWTLSSSICISISRLIIIAQSMGGVLFILVCRVFSCCSALTGDKYFNSTDSLASAHWPECYNRQNRPVWSRWTSKNLIGGMFVTYMFVTYSKQGDYFSSFVGLCNYSAYSHWIILVD